MDSSVSRLAEDSGELTAIRAESAEGGGYVAVAFDFPAGTLHCRCNPDTDEIIVEVARSDSPSYPAVHDESLARLVGMVVEYAWEMTNHRGYRDAFQLRFTNGEGREETRQFEVLASVMAVGVVTVQPGIARPS